jgi:hypothetical protein
MKVEEFTQDRLVLQMRGEGILFTIMGLVMLVGTLIGTYFLAQSTTLTCQRVESNLVNCALERTLFGMSLRTRDIYDLHDVQLAERGDSDGDTMYRVNLYTREGTIPLTSYSSSSYRKHVTHAEEISKFLQGSEINLTLKVKPGLFWLLTLVFSVGGLALFITGINTFFSNWTFDKVSGQIIHHREGLTGAKERSYELSNVIDAFVREKHSSDSTTYRIELRTRDDAPIPLTSYYSSGYRKKKEVVNYIQDFLNS